jgi:hypothetical protein
VLGLLICLAASSAFATALTIAFRMPVWGGAIWGLAALVGSFIYLTKRVLGQLEVAMKGVEAAVQSGKPDKATELLRGAYRFNKWHPLLGAQLDAQLGALLYVQDDVDDSIPHLRRSTLRTWIPRTMLGCALFKKKDVDGMRRAFEEVLKKHPKEGLGWTVYAYCLRESDDRAGAIAALERGVAASPQDPRLKTNLERTKEGKKLKVEPYGASWAQFKLGPPLRMTPGPGHAAMQHPALKRMKRGKR